MREAIKVDYSFSSAYTVSPVDEVPGTGCYLELGPTPPGSGRVLLQVGSETGSWAAMVKNGNRSVAAAYSGRHTAPSPGAVAVVAQAPNPALGVRSGARSACSPLMGAFRDVPKRLHHSGRLFDDRRCYEVVAAGLRCPG